MMMMLLVGLMTDDGHRSNAAVKKRKKYNMQRMTFNNPHTMDRKPYTFHHNLWYCNYITDLAPHNEIWSRLFRQQFSMPYSTCMDLTDQCL